MLFCSLNKDGRVYSFEHLPINTIFFKERIVLNGVTNYELFEIAVADAEGAFKFSKSKSSIAGKLSEDGQILVTVRQLSKMLGNEEIGVPEIIKMDMEGAEIDVLGDIKKILEQYKPVLFPSTRGQKVHDACIEFLKSIKFELLPLDTTLISTARELLAACSKQKAS